jgi:hypothetical protein
MNDACSSTSTTTVAFAMSSGSSSLFAGLSAPMAATKVPGRTCSMPRNGSRAVVQVTMASLARVAAPRSSTA